MPAARRQGGVVVGGGQYQSASGLGKHNGFNLRLLTHGGSHDATEFEK
jgi:hypothetical protein